jgi:hypothetical protein
LGNRFLGTKKDPCCVVTSLEINKTRPEEFRDGVKVKDCEHLVAYAARMLDEYLEELKG